MLVLKGFLLIMSEELCIDTSICMVNSRLTNAARLCLNTTANGFHAPSRAQKPLTPSFPRYVHFLTGLSDRRLPASATEAMSLQGCAIANGHGTAAAAKGP